MSGLATLAAAASAAGTAASPAAPVGTLAPISGRVSAAFLFRPAISDSSSSAGTGPERGGSCASPTAHGGRQRPELASQVGDDVDAVRLLREEALAVDVQHPEGRPGGQPDVGVR